MLAKCVGDGTWVRTNQFSAWQRFRRVIQPSWNPPAPGPRNGEVCNVIWVDVGDDGKIYLSLAGYLRHGRYNARWFVPLQDQLTEDLERIEKEGAPAEPEPELQPQHEH